MIEPAGLRAQSERPPYNRPPPRAEPLEEATGVYAYDCED